MSESQDVYTRSRLTAAVTLKVQTLAGSRMLNEAKPGLIEESAGTMKSVSCNGNLSPKTASPPRPLSPVMLTVNGYGKVGPKMPLPVSIVRLPTAFTVLAVRWPFRSMTVTLDHVSATLHRRLLCNLLQAVWGGI